MDLTLRRGDTPIRAYKFFNDQLTPLRLYGVTIWFTVKAADYPQPDPSDASALIKHHIKFDNNGAVEGTPAGFTLGGIDPDPDSPTFGQYVTGPDNGVVTHKIPFSESNVLIPGEYVYDIQLYIAANDYYETLVNDATFTVVGDVTRRGTTP